MKTIFITGIDTDSGKTIATGLLARYLLKNNKKIITAKLVQTGNSNEISDDIHTHRKIMNCNLFPEDTAKTTCQYIYSFPASPHLAAELNNEKINIDFIDHNLKKLQHKYDIILLEGAGGLFVPLRGKYTIFNFIKERNMPVILVTTPKLGSINHTLLTLTLLQEHNIPINGIIYNKFIDVDKLILKNTAEYLKSYFNEISFIEIEKINNSDLTITPDYDFSSFF